MAEMGASAGVGMPALFLDLPATEKKRPSELIKTLQGMCGSYFTKRLALHLPEAECEAIMTRLRTEPTLEFMGRSLIAQRAFRV
ncbi:MAG: hypothetical protein ACREJQ_04525 [bacterium]